MAQGAHCGSAVPMNAIGYLRVSTQEQGDSGAGLAAQEATILSECSRRQWAVDFVTDSGYTAANLQRPGIQEALDRLDRGESDTLIVAKLDRLSRSILDFVTLMDRARINGWSIVCLDMAVDTTTPAGEVVANIMASFAQFERRLISDRTREALAEKRKQGVQLGRPPSISHEAMERIRHYRTTSPPTPFRLIAERLTEEGVPTAQGGKWWPETIRLASKRLA